MQMQLMLVHVSSRWQAPTWVLHQRWCGTRLSPGAVLLAHEPAGSQATGRRRLARAQTPKDLLASDRTHAARDYPATL